MALILGRIPAQEGARTLGVLLGPSNAALQAPLAQLAERLGYKLVVRQVNEQAALLPALQQTLEPSDALLALPDPLVFSRNTAQTVLLTSYRHQTPVIGYSRAYVTAGALAAVFSTPEQIAQQAAIPTPLSSLKYHSVPFHSQMSQPYRNSQKK